MNKNEYYNTLYGVFFDGRKIWDEYTSQVGFVPKGKTQPYFKIKGVLVSRKQLFNNRFCIKMLPKCKEDEILKLFDNLLPKWCNL